MSSPVDWCVDGASVRSLIACRFNTVEMCVHSALAGVLWPDSVAARVDNLEYLYFEGKYKTHSVNEKTSSCTGCLLW